MPAKKYIVRLSEEERQTLKMIIGKGKSAAYRIKHANILLKADADGSNWPDERVVEAFECHRNTVENVRKRFVTQGFEAALERKKRLTPPRKKIIDGEREARIIAISRTTPPPGRAKWSLRLLADKIVELGIVESASHMTVQRALKKTNSSLT